MKRLIAVLLVLAACAPRYSSPLKLRPYPFPPVNHIVWQLPCDSTCAMWYSPSFTNIWHDDIYVIGAYKFFDPDNGDVLYKAHCGACP